MALILVSIHSINSRESRHSSVELEKSVVVSLQRTIIVALSKIEET
jgi:hypothetical protein